VDGVNFDVEVIFGVSGADFLVVGVDAASGDAVVYLVVGGGGVRHVFIFQVFRRTVLMEDDGFHAGHLAWLDAAELQGSVNAGFCT
jgi:hypothetical protein